MPISKSVLNYLAKQKIKFAVSTHRKVFTAIDKAATLHTDPKTVLKTAVFGAGKEYFLVVVPANKNIDIVNVKKAYGLMLKKLGQKPADKIDFAKEAWMKKNLAGDIGATPVMPELLKMTVLVDDGALKPAKLYVNAGCYEQSLILNQANFKKLLGKDFVKGSFAKAKK